jgi:hypothetical protein
MCQRDCADSRWSSEELDRAIEFFKMSPPASRARPTVALLFASVSIIRDLSSCFAPLVVVADFEDELFFGWLEF